MKFNKYHFFFRHKNVTSYFFLQFTLNYLFVQTIKRYYFLSQYYCNTLILIKKETSTILKKILLVNYKKSIINRYYVCNIFSNNKIIFKKLTDVKTEVTNAIVIFNRLTIVQK